MNSRHQWPLFRLCLAGTVSRGSCWLLLGGLPLYVWLAPHLTPWQENPPILQPARAQAAWHYAWFALGAWMLFQAATLGRRLRMEGMLEHQRANGMSAMSLWLQLTAAVAVWLLVVALMAFSVCVLFALPKNPDEASSWVILCGQYALLYLSVAIPLLLLGVSLATRAAEILAFLVPAVLLFLGHFGSMWLEPMLVGGGSDFLHSLWLAIPHYHLADLTPRLVFKMGALHAGDFFGSLGVLAAQGAALFLFGLCTLRTRS